MKKVVLAAALMGLTAPVFANEGEMDGMGSAPAGEMAPDVDQKEAARKAKKKAKRAAKKAKRAAARKAKKAKKAAKRPAAPAETHDDAIHADEGMIDHSDHQ